MSENIQVVSIIDRYLEHARIFRFSNGGAEELFLSSADWMPRNLERRIELMFPILNEELKKRVCDILDIWFRDDSRARILGANGEWILARAPEGEEPFRAQARLYEAVRESVEAARHAPKQEFIVRRRPPNAKE
jgi:polyphosphate kinase